MLLILINNLHGIIQKETEASCARYFKKISRLTFFCHWYFKLEKSPCMDPLGPKICSPKLLTDGSEITLWVLWKCAVVVVCHWSVHILCWLLIFLSIFDGFRRTGKGRGSEVSMKSWYFCFRIWEKPLENISHWLISRWDPFYSLGMTEQKTTTTHYHCLEFSFLNSSLFLPFFFYDLAIYSKRAIWLYIVFKISKRKNGLWIGILVHVFQRKMYKKIFFPNPIY